MQTTVPVDQNGLHIPYNYGFQDSTDTVARFHVSCRDGMVQDSHGHDLRHQHQATEQQSIGHAHVVSRAAYAKLEVKEVK